MELVDDTKLCALRYVPGRIPETTRTCVHMKGVILHKCCPLVTEFRLFINCHETYYEATSHNLYEYEFILCEVNTSYFTREIG